MEKVNFLEKILMLCTNRCIELEIWTWTISELNNPYKGGKLEQYVDDVISKLEEHYPQIKVISKQKYKYCEARTHPCLAFPGYIVKLAPNIDMLNLKEKCMELEINESSKRISDIDIYYKHKKISRKSLNKLGDK